MTLSQINTKRYLENGGGPKHPAGFKGAVRQLELDVLHLLLQEQGPEEIKGVTDWVGETPLRGGIS